MGCMKTNDTRAGNTKRSDAVDGGGGCDERKHDVVTGTNRTVGTKS